MEGDLDSSDEFFERFSQHLSQIDEIASIVLRGHLLVEQDLDSVIEAIFFYPQYVTRLSFERKIQIARAMALRMQEDPAWETLRTLNLLRNGIAHSSDIDDRRKKLAELRHACMKQMNPEAQRQHEGDSDKEIVILGCALCCGHLAILEEALVEMHAVIRELDEEIHPHLQRMPIKSVREG
ncbi:hypothetical protein DYI24_22465 [Rhodopseudomonas sp. BR0C11]|uniref:hypothetical protein n=1 Tax=Rhodopseudomonas sp. BR0C11 TaxID=2269370 RepID=UPI0013DEA4FD|nr:hypothetical protein [Rhodopseudomonas sp. BR0C11]NEV79801.1 hypothetical protein [Rhodopseudomonas sp. BR0C11]